MRTRMHDSPAGGKQREQRALLLHLMAPTKVYQSNLMNIVEQHKGAETIEHHPKPVPGG